VNHLNQRKSPSALLVSNEIETDFSSSSFPPKSREVPEVADLSIVCGWGEIWGVRKEDLCGWLSKARSSAKVGVGRKCAQNEREKAKREDGNFEEQRTKNRVVSDR
jgi:hypothetical protein